MDNSSLFFLIFKFPCSPDCDSAVMSFCKDSSVVKR